MPLGLELPPVAKDRNFQEVAALEAGAVHTSLRILVVAVRPCLGLCLCTADVCRLEEGELDEGAVRPVVDLALGECVGDQRLVRRCNSEVAQGRLLVDSWEVAEVEG